MTPDQRDIAIKKGLIILRPHFDSNNNNWRIKMTCVDNKTGWKISKSWTSSTEREIITTINDVVSMYPDQFVSEFSSKN